MTSTASQRKPRTPPNQQQLDRRRQLADTFPASGRVQRRWCAAYLGIAPSTFDWYVSQGRIAKGVKYSQRLRVWDASYIRQIADEGIPQAAGGGGLMTDKKKADPQASQQNTPAADVDRVRTSLVSKNAKTQK